MSESLKSDKGYARENNEDNVGMATNNDGDKLYILCDGMGGYKGGEIASYECVKYFKDKFKDSYHKNCQEAKEWLYTTSVSANDYIQNIAKEKDLIGMGTTMVCLLISKDYKVYASVGDSRIYSYSSRDLNQLSEDQTFTNALLKAGYINEKEASLHPKKNMLLCAIGSSSIDDLDVQVEEIKSKDNNYLICSDGLYNMVSNKDIFKLINSDMSIELKADSLINLANENGGEDNISVILVEENI